MKKEMDLRKEIDLKRTLYIISIVLLVVSSYMYWVMDKNQVRWQSPAVSILPTVEEHKTQPKKDNPFVIRNGSNAMPKGMGQLDNSQGSPKFIPQWQKDKLKDMKGLPYDAENQQSDQQPAPGSPQTAPSPSQATPASRPNVDLGQGLTPSTFNKNEPGGNPGAGSAP